MAVRSWIQALRAVGQPMLGDIPAGLTGLGSMLAGEGMDKAAERTRRVQQDFEYTPDDPEAQKILGKVGQAVDFGRDLWNAQKGAPAIAAGWEKLTQKAPAVAATALGVAGVIDPLPGRAGAAAKAVDTGTEAARIAALRQVRETTPMGPAFRSVVEEEAAKLQPRGTVGQFVQTLRNKPGVKGEELADLGVDSWDQSEVITRDTLLDRIKGNRAPREERRQSYDMIPEDLMSEKVTDVADMDLRTAVGRPDSYTAMGLEKFIPIDEHPDLAVTRQNQERAAKWDEYTQQDPELWAAALDYVVEDMDYHGNKKAQQLWDDFTRGDPDAEEKLNGMANAILANARDNKKLYGELADLRGAELDARWKELEPQYGSLRGAGDTARAHFTQRLQDTPGVQEQLWNSAEQRIRTDPGQFSWGEYEGRPAYPQMRYYGDIPDTSGRYSEVLESQGPLPWAPDQRQYNEGHWATPTPGAKNDVTMHLRGEMAQTPEGSPAWFLNELQSKYAANVGERGTTLDPLEIEHGRVLADRQVAEAVKMLEDPEAVNWYDFNENTPWGEEFVDTVRDIADRGTQPSAEELQKLKELADRAHGVAGDMSYITHRGTPFIQRPFGSDPADQGKAAAVRDALQRGIDPATTELQTLNRGISPELDKYVDDTQAAITPFKHDTRMPPRAGTKSWRLRGLKMALRQAVEQGANDLYIPQGQMMPRIEQWGPEIDELNDLNMPRDEADAQSASMILDSDLADEYGWDKVMANYDQRLPKEWAKYLKEFGAKLEKDTVLPPTGDAAQAATAQRIKITPELLAEVLRGQRLYQVAGGAGLLGLLLNQQEEPQL